MNRPESDRLLSEDALSMPGNDETRVGEIIGRNLLECAPDEPCTRPRGA